jgi:hypothetical protein
MFNTLVVLTVLIQVLLVCEGNLACVLRIVAVSRQLKLFYPAFCILQGWEKFVLLFTSENTALDVLLKEISLQERRSTEIACPRKQPVI